MSVIEGRYLQRDLVRKRQIGIVCIFTLDINIVCLCECVRERERESVFVCVHVCVK